MYITRKTLDLLNQLFSDQSVTSVQVWMPESRAEKFGAAVFTGPKIASRHFSPSENECLSRALMELRGERQFSNYH